MENARASRQPNRFPAAPTHANKTVNYGGFEAKALFDDVYGGPPKFGVSTLSPRAEDYSEIFESFHSSRASSIPVLDLPAVDESEVFFDVRSSSLDYAEVFRDFDGLDCAVSYEDLLFDQYKGGDRDSSDDEAWTPAGSGYLSEDSDHSEKNHCFSNGDFCQPFDGDAEMLYHKANQTSSKDMRSGATHITELDAVPGYTFELEEIDRLQKTDENPILQMTDDDNLSMDFSVGMMKGKHLKKTMSQPFNDATCRQTFGNDLKPQKAYARSGSLSNEMFVTVSDISLRTQPSQLPPPSRPPPSTDVTKEVSSRLTSNSKSIASEGSDGDRSPPFFDVEVDASSSAAAMKEAMTKAQVKLRSAKEFMERKEGVHGSAKMGSKNHITDKEGKVSKIVDECDSLRNDRMQSTYNREDNSMKFSVREETQKVRKVAQDVPDSMEGEKLLQAAKKSAEKKHSKEYWSSLGPVKIEGSSDWKEALQSIELVRTVKSSNALEQSSHTEISVHNAKTHEQGWEKNADLGVFELQEEENKKVMSAIGKHDLEYEKKSEVENEVWKGEEKGEEEYSFEVLGENERSKATKEAQRKKKVKEAQVVFEKLKNEKKVRIAQKHTETENKSTGAGVSESCNGLFEVQKEKYKSEVEQAMNHKENEQKEANKRMEREELIRGLCGKEDNEKRKNKTFEVDENVRGHEEPLDGAEDAKNVKEALEHKGSEKRLKQEANERDENQKNQKEACKTQERESILKEALEQAEKTKLLQNIVEQEEKTKLLQNIVEREVHEKRLKGLKEKDDEKQREFHKGEKNEKEQQETYQITENEKRLKDACAKEEKNLYGASEKENKSEKLKGAQEGSDCGRRSKEGFELEEIEKESTEASIWKESEKRLKDAGGKELKGLSEVHEQSERDENGKTLKQAKGTCVHKELEDLGVSDGAWNLDDSENLQAPTKLASKDNENGGKLEDTQESIAHEQKEKTESEHKDKEKDTEVVKNADAPAGDKFEASDIAQGDLGLKEDQSRMEDATKSPPLDDNAKKVGEPGFGVRQTHIYKSVSQVDTFPINQERKIVHELGDTGNNVKQAQPVLNQEESKDRSLPTQVRKDWVENGKKIEAARPSVLEVKGNIQKAAPHVNARQTRERQEKKLNETSTSEDKEMERVKREQELEMDRLRKMEEEREREREREKDRMAVDRKTLETRERAYTEARDKAERAAVERAMAEARERLEKACAEAREKTFSEKATVEARLRAERAAVERATTEARERAVERAMAEKAAFGMRERVERSVSDKFPASVRNNEIKQSSSFSFYGAAYPTEQSEGVEGESPQRCKARLERYQRTTERAAKALAEKNMRDLLAQREQAERNRLAETLDADVRRWSSGKEGNLRALLSTLQYILGPDSGWQPIPLTEVITAASVKKAYRKATLCVHPDKLQQRGASIQQKYICEKVFDLLKEAWNKFNSEER
ncbi:auxilin-like protein 1 [Juglans microcarpa x Juglans regia]|uniref:auxilin-like protein 1 n=1 Tax=Juglans microcarpa x Juglans regia TaxID=2249226 RepID=UPI001B7ED888|nr:auxilin-like protein 1 [Juglans microcarpa x Juglans regia]XP_041009381.1 auxilin-like protein 1 [Juglans microcarpa x Juglans regia]